jgi:alanine dehydrogenase
LPNLEQVSIWSLEEDLAWQVKQDLEPQLGVEIKVCPDPKSAVQDADVIVTTTPSRKPLVQSEWVSEGVHFTCIGADAPGKQELDPAILRRARVFLDDMAQGMESGEVNVPLQKGLLKPEDIIGELGEVLIGKKDGRTSDDEITVFSSTGLAIQDIACGAVVLRKLGVL